MKNLVVVLAGPSGVGKDSVMLGLIEKHPNTYQKFANTTTREKRPGEVEGINYYYVNAEEFLRRVKDGEVFEHVHHYGNYYGMSKKAIEAVWKQSKIAINNCQINGIRETKKLYGNNCLTVFISAPRAVVEARLIGRGDSEEQRKIRADYDEFMALEPEFDAGLENKNLEKAIDDLHNIILKYQGE